MATFDYTQFYKVKSPTGYDIFRVGGEKMSYEEATPMFQSGFNVELVPEKMAEPAPAPQPTPTPTLQPTPAPAPAPAPEPAYTSITGAENVPLSQSGQFYKVGNDVFETGTNRPIELAELKEKGLNFKFIPEKSELFGTLAGEAAEAGEKFPAEFMTALEAPLDEEKTKQELYTKYGISDLETKFLEKPTQTFEDVFKRVYDTLGLSQLKTDMDKIREQINKADADFSTAIGNINENPWLSEAGRVGRIAKTQEMYSRTSARLQNQMTLLTNQYDRGKQEAENVATRTLQTFEKTRGYAQEELNYYLKRAEADLEAKRKMQEIEQVGKALRYYPEYLKKFKKAPTATGIVGEYEYYAQQERAAGRIPLSFNEYQKEKPEAEPTSFKEWKLAGGEKGTGFKYAKWVLEAKETQTDRDRALKIAAFSKARPALEAVRGEDGFVDPITYMRLRTDYAEVMGDANEFDEMFAPMLSLKERMKLGVGKVSL